MPTRLSIPDQQASEYGMKPLLLLILAFNFSLLFPRDAGFISISGIVRDAVTGKPVPYASISFEEGYSGVVSNQEGAFRLTIPQGRMTENAGIMVSRIGYGRSYFHPDSIAGARIEILLVPRTVNMNEVSVRPTDARSIVAAALRHVDENYPLTPLRLTGFYRETIMRKRDYVSIMEAIVDIHKASYGSRENDLLTMVRGRKSGSTGRADTLLVKLQGGPHVSMLLDIIKNQDLLFGDNLGNYFFIVEDIVIMDEVPHYEITFGPRAMVDYPLYYGKLYISVDRKALSMAEFSLDLSDRALAVQSFILRKPARLRFIPESTKYLVQYKEVEGKYYIDYVRYELEFSADWRRRLFKTGYSVMSEMAVTGREALSPDEFSLHGSGITASAADLFPSFFDDEFWIGYNYIEPEQSMLEAIRKLNKTWMTGE
jgi:hypothetical protein